MRKFNHGDVIVNKETGDVGVYRIDKTPKGSEARWWDGNEYGFILDCEDVVVLGNIAEYSQPKVLDIQNTEAFEVKNQLIITDPCYEVGAWCAQSFHFNVKPGMWQGHLAENNNAQRFLLVHHVDNPTVLSNFDATSFTGELGVDSGTIGVFNRWVEKNEYDAMLNDDLFPFVHEKTAAFSFGCFACTTNGDGTQQYKCLRDGGIYAVLVSLD